MGGFTDGKTEAEHECLAVNLYHEARGETVAGKVAVVQTVLNRAKLNHRGSQNICEVVYDRKQFSWTSDQNLVSKRLTKEQLMPMYQVVYSVIYNKSKTPDLAKGSEYYYNPKKASPRWSKSKKLMYVAKVGNHIFMKKKT